MNAAKPAARAGRADFLLIASMVEAGSRVLDVGCDDGGLLALLAEEKNVDGRGIELGQDGVNESVSRGLSVIQGDANTDLYDYPDGAFDYVILSRTLPAIHRPRDVLTEMLRISRHAIVSIPNAGYWRHRLYLLLRGKMPVTDSDEATWWNADNIHPCTIRDFILLCTENGFTIERRVQLGSGGRAIRFSKSATFANFFGEQAVFQLTKKA